MPKGFVSEAPPPSPTELKIKNNTPARLTNTPPIFLKVMGSFKAMAATNMVRMGVQVFVMLVSMEVVMVMAFKKLSCVRKRPNMEAMKIFGRSFFSTFSLGMKSDNSQNKAVAPIARRQNRSMGVSTCALEMFLQQTMLNPKMQYAPKQARWPMSIDLSFMALEFDEGPIPNNAAKVRIFFAILQPQFGFEIKDR